MAITTPSHTPPGTSVLQFVRKGQVQGLGNVPPTQTLLALLRDNLGLTGTKEGCRSGDCGACTVVLAQPDGHGGLHYRAVNSCIQLAHAAHGQALWTVEDLAQGTQAHPVQQALVQHHASQCGFCTPGFVMSLFALYQTRLGESARHGTPPAPVTRDQALHALSGNLCRCTGYRPILDAAQTMLAEPTQTVDEAATVLKLEQINQSNKAADANLVDETCSTGYLLPTTLASLLHARARFPQAQLVAGCTDVGIWVTKLQHAPAQVLDLTRVTELRRIENVVPPHGAQATPTAPTAQGAPASSALATPAATPPSTAWLSIGAAVTLTDAFDALVATRPALATFTSRFAGLPVRNAGTLGGNVANGSPIGDSMPLLLALGAHVRLMQWGAGATDSAVPADGTALQSRTLPLDQFYTGYRQTALAPAEVLTHILVPPPGPAITPHPDTTTLNGEWLRAYKISKRFEDDISAVCLGLRLVLRNGVVAEVSIGVGGVAATPVRALQTQAALLGQPWTQATATQAAAVLQA
ncbi:MAG: FAD binding domain-containing protein, partial [Burkholderiales bacterium]|nr:FAD binding domain-containing protein [Burkholderiales bacterium]